MKKLIAAISVLTIMFSFGACGSTDTSSSNTTSPSSNSSSNSSSDFTEDVAKGFIVKEFRKTLGGTYDISNSRFTFGSVNFIGFFYDIKGMVYLYDGYGQYRKTAKFSAKVHYDGEVELEYHLQ